MPNGTNLLSEAPGPVETETDVLADVLETLRLTNLVFGRFELGAPWGLRFRGSSLAHFLVMVRGSAVLRAGETTQSLSAGDVAVLPQAGPFSLGDSPDTPPQELELGQCRHHASTCEPIVLGGGGARTSLVSGAFRLDSRDRNGLLGGLPSLIHLPSNDPRAAPWLGGIVQAITVESSTRAPGSSVVIGRLADVLLIQALRLQMQSGTCPGHGLQALADPAIRQALGLMHGRPGDAWTVESLASAVGVSRSGFAARFTALVGEPPLQYLARWRMTKAAQQLRENTHTMSEIAERAGYQSEAAFNKAFKRWEGTAPGAYRRSHKAGSRSATPA